jgi:hypothetical protein
MNSFSSIYKEFLKEKYSGIANQVSIELRTWFERLFEATVCETPDIVKVKRAIVGLLEHLSSTRGRTDANCVMADAFIGMVIEEQRAELPQEYSDILSSMCCELHDTVSSPEIAEMFDSTPEQLLERAKRLQE